MIQLQGVHDKELQLTIDDLLRDLIRQLLPDLIGLVGRCQQEGAAGFDIREDTVLGGRTLRPEGDSGLAREALKYGVTLDVEFHCLVAAKPIGDV